MIRITYFANFRPDVGFGKSSLWRSVVTIVSLIRSGGFTVLLSCTCVAVSGSGFTNR